MAEAAEVVKVVKREGPKGISIVKCRLLEGKKKDKILERAVIGRIKEGDIIYLKETEMETAYA
ncbi:MAG TPA: 30S ribosomal protein S28e [Candidatus Aenigmarchaeota archaeon]|nr:30S ribosomal protein S28e [Candidatus Aenigmarchaeota archaeon]RLJ03796.1 MAG: 30S ribosomal protein S28e [Candidatus Aenigmarchaeota archaeon]HDI06514.1 30S ribosomal protein S28e [Candidatus Aenigmarchaeota archaeon]